MSWQCASQLCNQCWDGWMSLGYPSWWSVRQEVETPVWAYPYPVSSFARPFSRQLGWHAQLPLHRVLIRSQVGNAISTFSMNVLMDLGQHLVLLVHLPLCSIEVRTRPMIDYGWTLMKIGALHASACSKRSNQIKTPEVTWWQTGLADLYFGHPL